MADMVTYPLNKIEYQATDAELFHSTRTSGVYSGDDFSMSVTGANNIVTFEPGIAWIRNGKFSGKVVASKSAVSVDLGVANASLPRWDIVCIQFDKNKNATDIVVKTGVAASSPVMPAISQTETLYELYLCKVYRPAGSATITAGNVYDLRLDDTVCGLMADSVTKIDTSAINAQINEFIEELRAEIGGIGNTAGLMPKSTYDTNNNGVVDKAEKLATAVKIGNASFDGSKSVTLAEMGAATSVQGTRADNAMPKSGGTFTSDVTINNGSLDVKSGQVRCTGSGRFGTGTYTNQIELYRDTPFIDFHFGTTLDVSKPSDSPDFTSRIIEDNQGHLTIQAGLNVTGTFTNNSDRRLKENIVEMKDNLIMPMSENGQPIDIYSELFDRLKPSQYTMKKGDNKLVFGFIAQDIVSAMEEVGYSENDLDLIHHRHWVDVDTKEEKELYSVGQLNLLALLVYEMQKLKAEIKQLKKGE